MSHPVVRAVLTLAVASVATPVLAMDQYASAVPGARVSIADPDAALERMIANATPSAVGHGKPQKGVTALLKDDPVLRRAFAALDNR